MNILKEDPRVTAYALGEMNQDEAHAFLSELKSQNISNEDLDKEVIRIQKVGQKLNEDWSKERVLLSRKIKTPKSWSLSLLSWIHTIPKSLKVGIPAFAILALVVMNIKQLTSSKKDLSNPVILTEPAKVNTTEGRIEMAEDPVDKISILAASPQRSLKEGAIAKRKGVSLGGSVGQRVFFGRSPVFEPSGEQYAKMTENEYVLVQDQPLSTFSIDVDTASYANVRRMIMNGNLSSVNSNAVRTEEFINYFSYDYKYENKDHPIDVKLDIVQSPWNKGRKLVRVAMMSKRDLNLEQAPKNLVFLVDVSGSMGDANKLPLLKESFKNFLYELKPKDRVAIVVYAGAAGLVLPSTPVANRAEIIKSLNLLNSGGSTNGGKGIQLAYKIAKENFVKNGVNRVLLATDGDFNVGVSQNGDLEKLIQEEAKSGVFLSVLGLGMGNYHDKNLETIADKGNGNYFYIDTLSEADKVFKRDLNKNVVTVAKDVKVQIEFNPGLVKAYKLIGYENRKMAAEDFNNDKKDAGEIGSGATVTALYEIVPVGQEAPESKSIDKLKYQKQEPVKKEPKPELNDFGPELLTAKVRYKNPKESKSIKFEKVLNDSNKSLASQDMDFKFAVAVAGFALKLRKESVVDKWTYQDIKALAKDSLGIDKSNERKQFLDLIEIVNK